ncbi:MAG TPA: methyltransferase domain-containing protein [Planctomycetota bacterium]
MIDPAPSTTARTDVGPEAHLRCPDCGGSLAAAAEGARCEPCFRVFAHRHGGFDLRPKAAASASDAAKDHQAGIYDEMLGEVTSFDHPHNLTLVHQRNLLRRAELRPGDRVLELGGHRSGLFGWLEREFGAVGTGIDVSSTWVEVQNRDAEARGEGSRWHLADAERLPFADGSFAAVVSFDVFEHLPDPKQALAECMRVLRPGGRLVAHQPVRDVGGSLDGLERLVTGSRWRRRQESVGHFHQKMLSGGELRAHLEELGFELDAFQRFNVWVQPLHDHNWLPFLGSMRRRFAKAPAAAPPVAGAAPAAEPVRASGFQRLYARLVVPVARVLCLPDLLGRACGVGGSCSYLARRP